MYNEAKQQFKTFSYQVLYELTNKIAGYKLRLAEPC